MWGWERCRWRAEGSGGAYTRLLQNFGLVPLGYYVMKQLFGAWCLVLVTVPPAGVAPPLPAAVKRDLWVIYQRFSRGTVCTWQALEMLGSGHFHSVLYCCKAWGFGWLNIYSGGVTAVPRCHFTGADVCAAWLQTSISLWWLFAPPPSQALSLVGWCETIGFLLLGNVNPVLCPHGIQQWTLLRFEPCTEFWGLGKARVSGASAWIHKCKAVV